MGSTSYMEFETLILASGFCQILDDSNKYFLLSRFGTPKRKSYFQKLWEDNLQKADLIMAEALPILKLIREMVKYG